jgi:hypothetical protein
MNTCLNCKFALWKRTAAGKLHPDGMGRCSYVIPSRVIPSAFYIFGSDMPSGGSIDRSRLHEDCPTWEAKE